MVAGPLLLAGMINAPNVLDKSFDPPTTISGKNYLILA
jgi:hypothetical protein